DHTDDAAPRQGEIEAVDQQVVAVPFAQAPGLDDRITQTRTWSDIDFSGFNFLRGVFPEQLFVGVETSLTFRLASPRRHANPFEFAFERPLTTRLGLFFLRETILFLLQPRRVVAFPGDASTAIELEDPSRHVVQEVAIVGHSYDSALII